MTASPGRPETVLDILAATRPRAHLMALAIACALPFPCIAQTAAPVDPAATTPQAPFEVSEVQRKAYAQGMTEARALVAQKKYDDALARLDALARERPREPQARFLKAVVLTDQDKLDAALAEYRALAADFPEMPEPHNNLAVLYSRKGELGLARDELVTAVQTAPDYAVARENLGDVYAALAAEQYEKAAALDKRNRTATAKLKLVRDAAAVTP
ncbi:MAG: tetratricopeptide repeat protein [Betaproteobacteria bacterium]